MGMFDDIRCKAPLPLPQFQETIFQTKDTPNQYLDQYEIREDGTLWVEDYDTEDQSKAGVWLRENPGKKPEDAPADCQGIGGMCGCMTRVNKRWAQVADFHGDLRFYNTLGEHSSGWIEFSARFTDGKLVRLTLIEHRPIDPTREQESKKRIREIFGNP